LGLSKLCLDGCSYQFQAAGTCFAYAIKVEVAAFIWWRVNMPASALQVPSEIVTKYQEVVDLLAEITRFSAALVMKVSPPNLKGRARLLSMMTM
jgi:hypothetical protein